MPSAKLEICEDAELFDEHFDFDHTKYILIRGTWSEQDTTDEKRDAAEYFYAKVNKRVFSNAEIDLDTLDLIHIPAEHIWPQCPSSITRAPKSLPEDYYYVKRASLLNYEAGKGKHVIPEIVLGEAQVCEELRNNPHPNIAKYLGCKVVNGKIHALCFERYIMTLQERVETGKPLDTDRSLQGIKDGILHLHSLGLTHNDINPCNIMMDADDNPVIIDFDSCKREGEELVKGGTPGWMSERMLEDLGCGSYENDKFGFSKLEKFLSDI